MNHAIKSAITRFGNASAKAARMSDYTDDQWWEIEREHEMARANLERQIEKAIRAAGTGPAFATSA